MADQYVKYNGQDVLTGDDFKSNLDTAVKDYNAATGKNFTAKDYDYYLNPTTAGARWGETDPNPGASKPPSVNPAQPVENAAPVQAQASTYTPTQQTVSDKSTVQNQLAGITAQDSALNQLARTDANKQAARRGLLNSSIAVGAGQKAVLQSALPIAQQDANIYAGADAANAQFANSAGQFNASAQNNASNLNAQLGTQVGLANQNASLQQKLAQLQANTTLSVSDRDNQTKVLLGQLSADTQTKIATLDSNSKAALAKLDSDNKQLLQTNISAANSYAQYVQALSSIQNSTTLDGPAKQEAANSQLAALQAALKAYGQVSGLDLSQYFNPA